MLIFKNGKRGEMNADELGGKWKIRHKKSSFLISFGDQIVSIERDRPFALEF